MSHSRSRFLITAAAPLAALTLGAAEAAALELRMTPHANKIVNLAQTPSTVVVSNPMHADVTVLNKKLVIQARNVGTTNILVLDGKGNRLATFDVNVVPRTANRMRVYYAGHRITYKCDPDCAQVLTVGDFPNAFTTLQSQMAAAAGNGGDTSAGAPAQ